MSDEKDENEPVKAEETSIASTENLVACRDPYDVIKDAMSAHSELVDLLKKKLEELHQTKNEKGMLQYEVNLLVDRNKTMADLLRELRKRLFWQNNMDLVQLIDQNGGL